MARQQTAMEATAWAAGRSFNESNEQRRNFATSSQMPEGIDFQLLPVAQKWPRTQPQFTVPRVMMGFYLVVTRGAPPPPPTMHSYPRLPSLSVFYSPSSSQHMFRIKLAVLSLVRIVFPFLKLEIIS